MQSSRPALFAFRAATAACFLLLSCVVSEWSFAQTPGVDRVLIVYENESTLTAVVEVAQGLRSSMHQHMPVDVEVYSEYLDSVRFPDPARLEALAELFAAKYRGMEFDVVLAVGPGALQFVLKNRETVGPTTPVIFGAVSDSSLRTQVLPPDVKGVVSHFDVGKTVDLATDLQPDATQIVVMTGSSAFDAGWEKSARGVLGDRHSGLPVKYVSGLSIDGFSAVARELPKSTILLILTIFEDADGRKFIPRDATAKIAAVSSAPVYTVYSSFIGAGALAGYVGTFHAIGEGMGQLAARAMDGDSTVPQFTIVTDGPIVDWTRLEHWGINPAGIPENADIRNHELSPWDRYRFEIVTIAGVIVLQSATIIALFLQHRRRRRLEAELSMERLELAHLSRTSQLGELSGALAHELNQPLTSILANAEAGARLLDVDPVDLQELREILGDIVLDNKRAATVITQLRRLMIRGETSLEPIDLNQAVNTTLALSSSELLVRQTHVDAMLGLPEIQVRGNLAQLQQVILNLVLNAADAMSHLPPSRRQIAIKTRKRDDGWSELTVTDRGVGIPKNRHAEIFQPFVSSKKTSLGLGLAICRSIAQAHGGTLRFDESFHDGARAVFTLPPVQGDR